MKYHITWIILAQIVLCSTVIAQSTIINNYPPSYSAGGPMQQPQQPACNPYPTPNGVPPGHYTVKNGNGSVDQVYTTGTKQPYYVDNPCAQQQQPVIQPYIGINPPGNMSGNNNVQQPLKR